MRRRFLKTLATAAFAFAGSFSMIGGSNEAVAETPSRISIDYAYYNPVSLLLKEKGWLEEEFAEDGAEIRWVLSLGSNKALEFLNGRSVDFGSTAGAAALLGKANGNPIKSIYAYSQPEWTALVTGPESDIDSVEDLEGKRVAVTRGTDPHIFLLQALEKAGLSEDDINIVLLQHPDGGRALVSGQVDAWSGLDPHMAQHEVEDGVELFYRDASLNTYGILNVREAFAEEHPETVERVLEVYERGRAYALEHPEELRDILVEYASITPEIAEIQLGERTDLSDPVIDEEVRATLIAAGTVLREIEALPAETDIEALLDRLIDDRYVRNVVAVQEGAR